MNIIQRAMQTKNSYSYNQAKARTGLKSSLFGSVDKESHLIMAKKKNKSVEGNIRSAHQNNRDLNSIRSKSSIRSQSRYIAGQTKSTQKIQAELPKLRSKLMVSSEDKKEDDQIKGSRGKNGTMQSNKYLNGDVGL